VRRRIKQDLAIILVFMTLLSSQFAFMSGCGRPPQSSRTGDAPGVTGGVTSGDLFYLPSGTTGGDVVTFDPPPVVQARGAEEKPEADPLRYEAGSQDKPNSAVLQPLVRLLDRIYEVARNPYRDPSTILRRPYLLVHEDDPNEPIEISFELLVENELNGNVYEQYVPLEVVEKELAYLQPFDKIESLYLSHTGLNGDDLVRLAHLRGLKHLSLGGFQLYDSAFIFLSGFRELESLDLRGVSFSGENMEPLRELPLLTDVDVDPEIIDDEILEFLIPISPVLNMSGSRVTNEGIRSLAGADHIVALNLSHNPRVDDSSMLYVAAMTNLKTLVLVNTNVGDQGVSQLTGLDKLAFLNLNSSRNVSDRSAGILGSMDSLQHLLINRTGITDRGIPLIARLPRLRRLSIEGTDIGVNSLPHLVGMSSLEQLDVAGSGLSELMEADAQPEIPVSLVDDYLAVRLLNEPPMETSRAIVVPDIQSNANDSEQELVIEGISGLRELHLDLAGDLDKLSIRNCPDLESLILNSVPSQSQEGIEPVGFRSSIRRVDIFELDSLPRLKDFKIADVATPRIEGDGALERIERIALTGTISVDLIAALGSNERLTHVAARIDAITGPLSVLDAVGPFPSLVAFHLEGRDAQLLRICRGAESLAVAHIECGSVSGRELSLLETMRGLRSLYIDGLESDGNPLDVLNRLPILEECKVVRSSMDELRLKASCSLKTIQFDHSRIRVVAIHGPPTLSVMKFGDPMLHPNEWLSGKGYATPRSPRMVIEEFDISMMPSLRELELNIADNTNVIVSQFTVSECPVLEKLHFDAAGNLAEGSLTAPVSVRIDSQNTHLQEVSFEQMPLSPPLLQWIRYAPQLHTVRFQNCEVTSGHFVYLSRLPALKLLWLEHSNVSDGALRHLNRLPMLEEVCLLGTDVQGPGIANLAACPNFQRLNWPGMAIDSFDVVNRFDRFTDPFIEVEDPIDPEFCDRSIRVHDQPHWWGLKLTLRTEVDTIRIERCYRIRTLSLNSDRPGTPPPDKLVLNKMPQLSTITIAIPLREIVMDEMSGLQTVNLIGNARNDPVCREAFAQWLP
jgi:hypothetical protein